MGVDHHDVTLGGHLADAVQDQRGAGRLAGAGRAEQREVLAQHRVDIKPGADILGGEDLADGDAGAPVARIDLFKIAGGRRIDQRAGDRVAGNAAAEGVNIAGQLFLAAFAEEVDMGNDPAFGAAVLALVAHAGEQPGIADADLDLATDLPGQRDRGIGILHAFIDALQIERDLRARARNFQHHPDRQAPVILPPARIGSRDFLGARGIGAGEAFEILRGVIRHRRHVPRAGCITPLK